jgi:hypothetical protein
MAADPSGRRGFRSLSEKTATKSLEPAYDLPKAPA